MTFNTQAGLQDSRDKTVGLNYQKKNEILLLAGSLSLKIHFSVFQIILARASSTELMVRYQIPGREAFYFPAAK